MTDTQTEYIKLNLEKRTWTSKTSGNSGETYCFNNSGKNTINCFGHSATLSISKAGEKFNASQSSIFIWLNDMTKTERDAFVAEYGETIYIHEPTKELLTVEQYKELGIDTTIQPSVQPSASF